MSGFIRPLIGIFLLVAVVSVTCSDDSPNNSEMPDTTVSWAKKYDSLTTSYSVLITDNNNYLMTSLSYDGSYRINLVLCDSLGEIDTIYHYYLKSSGQLLMTETVDGGYVLVSGDGAKFPNIRLIKLDMDFDTTWTVLFGDAEFDNNPSSIIQTSDGGYLVGGNMRYSPDIDFTLTKINFTGTVEWTKTYGFEGSDEYISGLIETDDNGYMITGSTSVNEGNYRDIYILKTDDEGTVLWDTSYGGSDYDVGFSITAAPDSGYVITGVMKTYGTPGRNLLISKINDNGHIIWQRMLNGYNGRAIPTFDGGYAVVGFDEDYEHTVLVKTDALGNQLWYKEYELDFRNFGQSLAQTGEGGFLIVGGTKISDQLPYWSLQVIKTDANGDI